LRSTADGTKIRRENHLGCKKLWDKLPTSISAGFLNHQQYEHSGLKDSSLYIPRDKLHTSDSEMSLGHATRQLFFRSFAESNVGCNILKDERFH